MDKNRKQHVLKILFITLFIGFYLSSCIETDDVIDPQKLDDWEIINTSNGLSNNFVWDICEDNMGNIWVATIGGGACKFDGKYWKTINRSDGLISNDVRSLTQDNYGTYWFGTFDGLSILDGDRWINADSLWGEKLKVFALYASSWGDVYMATNNYGLVVYDYETDSFSQIFNSNCLPCNNINKIYEDSQRNLWLGTDSGLVKYKVNSNNYLTDAKHYTTADGLPTNEIYAVTEDSWGNIWVAGFGGEHVTKITNGQFEEINLNNDMPTYINSIEEDVLGNIWYGGISIGAVRYDGAIMRSYFEEDVLPDNTVFPIYSDSNGNLWIGTFEGGLAVHRPYLNN